MEPIDWNYWEPRPKGSLDIEAARSVQVGAVYRLYNKEAHMWMTFSTN